MKKFLSRIRIDSRVFLVVSVLYYEVLFRIVTCDPFWSAELITAMLFALVPAGVLIALTGWRNKRLNRILGTVLLSLLFVIYGAQTAYYGRFGAYFQFYSVQAGGVGQILSGNMLGQTISALVSALPMLLLYALPPVLFGIFANKSIRFRVRNRRVFKQCTAALSSVALFLILVLVVSLLPGLATVQSGEFTPRSSVQAFGLLRTEYLDLKYNVFGFSQGGDLVVEKPPERPVGPIINPTTNTVTTDTSSHITDTNTTTDTVTDPPIVIDTSPNILQINFEDLIASESNKTLKSMHEYFAAQEPSKKNEYTGMYEGYNLVMVTAEAFSPYAIDPVLTPTLYKMYQDGFKFTNFYTPIWEVSTSDGEYTVCTGLIPKSGVWSMYRSGSNYMPFCLGNMFSAAGVEKCFAYHNNTHTYYNRHISHPNMGYVYKAVGNGLEQYITPTWPQSDLQMIECTFADYLSDDRPFLAYYMTVSGHLDYTFVDNSMATRHKNLVKDLPYSEKVRGYKACNIELELAMKKLLEELNKAGVADRTVIAIAPDHYPYGLENETDKYSAWRELLGRDVETNFELYKSVFLLYCQGTTDAPTVDKYCASVDILPTLLNLFGLEYDSRLLSGTDILSDSEQLVIFENKSFICEAGMYNAKTKEFTLFDHVSFASEADKNAYLKYMITVVNNKFTVSKQILENDYYAKVLK